MLSRLQSYIVISASQRLYIRSLRDTRYILCSSDDPNERTGDKIFEESRFFIYNPNSERVDCFFGKSSLPSQLWRKMLPSQHIMSSLISYRISFYIRLCAGSYNTPCSFIKQRTAYMRGIQWATWLHMSLVAGALSSIATRYCWSPVMVNQIYGACPSRKGTWSSGDWTKGWILLSYRQRVVRCRSHPEQAERNQDDHMEQLACASSCSTTTRSMGRWTKRSDRPSGAVHRFKTP